MTDESDDRPGKAFRPRARLLQLLGDQLIGSPRLAIFELVKNGYDADASQVVVTMRDLTGADASVEVRDDGTGMSLETIENIWLVPGHDHKAAQREAGVRTDKGRLPLGEKGVGRFAVHKLGNVVEVVSREKGAAEESFLRIDWEDLSRIEFLADARVEPHHRPPQVFTGGSYGTLVRVTSLRGKPWTRGEVRRLARQVTSISSPFAERSEDFRTILVCPDQSSWLDELPDTETLVDLAPWVFDFRLDVNNHLTWSYEFLGIRNISLPPRSETGSESGVLLDPKDLPEERTEDGEAKPRKKAVRSTPEMQTGIGPISGRLYVYDRDPEVLTRIGFTQSLQAFLDETGGVRVYRDAIRVYNYGEPGDDWLGLDLRRVNSPSKRVSNNIVVGAIDLELDVSVGLSEKTNREGFVENDELGYFKALVLGVLSVFESERNKDKTAIRKLLARERRSSVSSIERPLESIRAAARKYNIVDEVEPFIEQAQKSFDEMRTIMLRAGVSNMSLVLVYHEVEHGIRLLERNLRDSSNDQTAVEYAKSLVSVIDGFGDLLRKNKTEEYDLRAVATRAVKVNGVRLRNHGITLETRLDPETPADPPIVQVPLAMVLGAVTNLFDNSIYWLDAKWPPDREEADRRLFVGVDTESFDGRPAIVVADNGPGFVDTLDDASEPFFTRRPDGLGVGLYYVNLIMYTIGGELVLLEPGDAAVPPAYTGAALALVFPRG